MKDAISKVLTRLRRLKRESGDSLIIVALAMTFLIACVAATVDFGMVYMKAAQLQTALDAGAMAGANFVGGKTTDKEAATAAALDAVQKNGIDPDTVDVSFLEGDTVIKLNSRKDVEMSFMRIVGISVMHISKQASAGAIETSAGGPFDYCLFSGDTSKTFTLGATYNIQGGVHSNGKLTIDGANKNSCYVATAEACGTIYQNIWTTRVGALTENCGYVEMPDFSESIDYVMPDSYPVTKSSSVINKEWRPQVWNESALINGNVNVSNGLVMNGDYYVNGDFTVNGSGVELHGNLFVDGDIRFNNTAKIYGCVFATGSITFSGGANYVEATTPVCVYSATGDIRITMANMTAHGIIYAPKGTVYLAGSNLHFYGSVVGNYIDGIPAGITMGKSDKEFPFIKSTKTAVKLLG